MRKLMATCLGQAGGERGGGKAWGLVLRVLRVAIRMEMLQEVPSEELSGLPGSFPGRVLSRQGSVINAAGPAVTVSCFCCLSGPGAEIPLRPRCSISREKRSGGPHQRCARVGKGTWGRGPPDNCPLLGTWAFRPGDLLLARRPCSAYNTRALKSEGGGRESPQPNRTPPGPRSCNLLSPPLLLAPPSRSTLPLSPLQRGWHLLQGAFQVQAVPVPLLGSHRRYAISTPA